MPEEVTVFVPFSVFGDCGAVSNVRLSVGKVVLFMVHGVRPEPSYAGAESKNF